jgi:parallel beta-helix repeat protein
MKLSKKFQTLITFTLIIGLLSVGTIAKASNSFIKLQPPVEGEWVISGLEIITDDVIINGSITIENGGELRIINSTVDFKANSSFSCTVELKDGATLYVENSNLRPSNALYNFTILADIVDNITTASAVTFIDSNVDDAFINIQNAADVTIDNTAFYGCSFYLKNGQNVVIDQGVFETGYTCLEIVQCVDVDITNSVFDGDEYGLKTTSVTSLFIDNVEFDSNWEIGLQTTSTNVRVNNSDFHHGAQGALFDLSVVRLYENTFWNLDNGLEVKNTNLALISQNNFTDIIGTCIEGDKASGEITKNRFVDCYQAAFLFKSPNLVEDNYFDNLSYGVVGLDSDNTDIINNDFYNIAEIGVELADSRTTTVSFNNFLNVSTGINIISGRITEIEGNLLEDVQEGIAVITSRELLLLGNIINQTVTGIYVEQSKDAIITANGAINAEYGISLWSCDDSGLASNGVFDSVYGISIWFSDYIRLQGNDVNTSDIGIVARNSINLQVRDGTFKELTLGLQIIGCTNPVVTGNSFDLISGAAITLDGSNGFKVYQNNFRTVGAYGEIENCLGLYYQEIDVGVFAGNYYLNEPGAPEVLIDTVTIDSTLYEIKDLYPLESSYTVVPSIEFVKRDILDPQDIDEVVVDSQIFVPSDTEDVVVYLQYSLNTEPTWTNIDITSSGVPVGSIGAINAYSGTIPAFDYDNLIIYRIMVEYTDELVTKQVFTENDSYIVEPSEFTQVYIATPEVYIMTVDEDGNEITAVTETFYENEDYMVQVRIANITQLETRLGKSHVNITWSEFDAATNITTGFTTIMDYNGTATVPFYYFAFGKKFEANAIIDYFISVVDINGTFYRTVNNYTIYIEPPPEATGFDALTLLSIGATLLLVQAIVVVRRRRKKEE